jgi:hypothetical protein
MILAGEQKKDMKDMPLCGKVKRGGGEHDDNPSSGNVVVSVEAAGQSAMDSSLLCASIARSDRRRSRRPR